MRNAPCASRSCPSSPSDTRGKRMAKLRHIAITVPDPHEAAEFYMRAFGMRKVGETDWTNARGRDFVGVHHFGFLVDDVDAVRNKIEAAGGTYWMGEEKKDGGFYEVKFHDPNGIAVDISANGWTGAEGPR